jgi:anti-sigma B factor antagonist
MKISRKKSKGSQILICDGELTIYTVAKAKSELLSPIDEGVDSVVLDLSAVSSLDTAGLQLILFAKSILADSNKRLRIKKSNEHIDSILQAFNLTNQLMLEG